MNLTTWHYIGIVILLLDIVWIVFYYYYATVKVYNFRENISQAGIHKRSVGMPTFQFAAACEHGKYQYLGYLWIRKKRGEYYLEIPQEMIEDSVTTEYKIVSQSWFHALRKGEKMHISFADKFQTEVRLSAQITVKNYIATSHQL